MRQLEGKVAVITGSTRGLGLAIAQAYTREGAAVVVSSRSDAAAKEAALQLRQAGAQASGQACDVGDLAQVQALAQHTRDTFGHFDIWVNNAAMAGIYGPTAHIAVYDVVRVLQTNILGVYYGSWVALQYFIPRGKGKLINIQGAGDRRPRPFQAAYTSSKAWVRSFTQSLAQECADSGVGIHALNPGLMHTDLLYKIDAVEGYTKGFKVLETVMRMWANPPEVPAQKALWLAGSATDGRTGLEVRMSSPGRLLGGALRELWRIITRRPAQPIHLDVHTVPPSFSEPEDHLL